MEATDPFGLLEDEEESDYREIYNSNPEIFDQALDELYPSFKIAYENGDAEHPFDYMEESEIKHVLSRAAIESFFPSRPMEEPAVEDTLHTGSSGEEVRIEN